MTLSVAELQPALYDLFTTDADRLTRQAGFCQRGRKLTGPAFAQSLVFSPLDYPKATLDDFAEMAFDALGIPATPQAFDKRFSGAAAEFLHDLLLEAFNRS